MSRRPSGTTKPRPNAGEPEPEGPLPNFLQQYQNPPQPSFLHPDNKEELLRALEGELGVVKGNRQIFEETERQEKTGQPQQESKPDPGQPGVGASGKHTKKHRKVFYRQADGKRVANMDMQTEPTDMADFFKAEDANVPTVPPPSEMVKPAQARNIQKTPANEDYLISVGKIPKKPKPPKQPRPSTNPPIVDKRGQRFKTFKEYLKKVYSQSPKLRVESSSSSEDDEKFHRGQRDSEWLQFTTSEPEEDGEDEQDDEEDQGQPGATLLEEKKSDKSAKSMDSNPQLKGQSRELGHAIWLLVWLLRCTGRLPVDPYVKGHITRYRISRCSLEYISFVVTSMFLIFSTILVFLSLSEIFHRPPLTSSVIMQVENLEFTKYGYYAWITLFYLFICTLWSLAIIFQDGYYLADYMTRWNLILNQLKHYKDYNGVHLACVLSSLWLLLYMGCLITLYVLAIKFDFEPVPAVRGTSGLLGLCVTRVFYPKIRFWENFEWIRGFGLFLHLYSIYCTRMIVLEIIVYSKIIENMARRWNLRTAYALGMLGRAHGQNRFVMYEIVVPFKKLFAEHKFIVFLQRYSGKLFSVGLNAYFTFTAMELILLLYYVISFVLYYEPPAKINVSRTPNNERITYADPYNNALLTGCFYLTQSLIGWFLTSENLRASGYCIMCGYNFIQRYGLLRCKNSKERRFILSLQFTFAPKTNYYLNPGYYRINRQFIFKMFFWIATITSLLILFHPSRIRTEVIPICKNGTCVYVRLPRSHYLIGADRKNLEDKMRDDFDKIVSETGIHV